MSSAPPGYTTLGPIYILIPVKDKFRNACDLDGVTMERKLKTIVNTVIVQRFPDFTIPPEPQE